MDFSWFKIQFDKIKGSLNFVRNNSHNIKVTPKIIDKSQQIHYHGMNVEDTTGLVKYIVSMELDGFREEAKQIADDRVADFMKPILDQLPKLQQAELNNLSEPDVQIALRDASILSGRRTDPDLRAVLANLVIGRIKTDTTKEFKSLLYNEAITTVGKLTSTQLNLLVITEILRYVSFDGIFSYEQYIDNLEKDLLPFVEITPKTADFQHIEYSGCGSIGIGKFELLNNIQKTYTTAFLKKFPTEEISALDLSDNIKDSFFTKEGIFICRVQNSAKLSEFLKTTGLPEEKTQPILDLYNKHIPSTGDIELKLKESSIGTKVLELWENSNLPNISLTSVGILIASTYHQEKTGKNIDMNPWYGES